MASDLALSLVADLSNVIDDARVLEAIAAVPRERFVPAELRHRAYENTALPIDCGQTISQPVVVARMLELLRLDGSERVLDVGTGSGYHAALLAHLARRVISVERHERLAELAARTLAELGLDNVEVLVGDGSGGVAERGPYEAINVAAAADPTIPDELVAQLAPGGRLVAPVASTPGRPDSQRLVLISFDGARTLRRVFEPVSFVPLVRGATTG
jgi:protein-L-isoaspartate(D-aspartate) O-methyltransferase